MGQKLKSRLRSDLWVVLLDIIAVNGAYLLALLIRFYVHFKFISGIGNFREYYLQFTPYYTLACLLVFYICGLYGGMWRYAGISDVYRIVLANVITSIIQVAGTKLLFHGMPTGYYIVGGFLQLLMAVSGGCSCSTGHPGVDAFQEESSSYKTCTETVSPTCWTPGNW